MDVIARACLQRCAVPFVPRGRHPHGVDESGTEAPSHAVSPPGQGTSARHSKRAGRAGGLSKGSRCYSAAAVSAVSLVWPYLSAPRRMWSVCRLPCSAGMRMLRHWLSVATGDRPLSAGNGDLSCP
jgi:hypothetical protein